MLSPETLAQEVQVTDDEIEGRLRAAPRRIQQAREAQPSQVLLTPDEARATALAAKWSSGADWATMQKEGANAVELTDAAKSEIPVAGTGRTPPSPRPQDTVPPPVHTALGWQVFKVTKITPGAGQAARRGDAGRLRKQVIADKAADLIYDRSSKLEDLLAGGATLETLPADLGLAAVTGTLDAKGNTLEGKPAPIPGPPSLVHALVGAAFQAKKGDPAHADRGTAREGRREGLFRRRCRTSRRRPRSRSTRSPTPCAPTGPVTPSAMSRRRRPPVSLPRSRRASPWPTPRRAGGATFAPVLVPPASTACRRNWSIRFRPCGRRRPWSDPDGFVDAVSNWRSSKKKKYGSVCSGSVGLAPRGRSDGTR